MENLVASLPNMPAPPHPNHRTSDRMRRWMYDMEAWVRVCRKIIAKNPNVQAPPMPLRDDYGDEGSADTAVYLHALQTWESVWD